MSWAKSLGVVGIFSSISGAAASVCSSMGNPFGSIFAQSANNESQVQIQSFFADGVDGTPYVKAMVDAVKSCNGEFWSDIPTDAFWKYIQQVAPRGDYFRFLFAMLDDPD